MKKSNDKSTLRITRSIPLLTFIAANVFMLDTAMGASPFYPIPAYLSSKSDTVKPNVMLMVDTSGSMSGSRITTAKSAYTDLVKNNPDLVRWGFSTFHVKDFIPIQDNNADTVVNQISKIVASGNTPTVPMYYQLIRYFEGLAPTTVTGSSSVTYYGDWAKRTNNSTTAPPFQYRCQKNFIINLSDGDANASSYLTERVGDSVFGSLSTSYNAFPEFSGKAYTHDFKTGGLDAEGKSWDDPNYPLQNIITYTIGFGTGMSSSGQLNLQQAAAAGGGKYYAAGDSAALVASLKDALANIAAIARSPTAPAYSTNGDGKKTDAIAVNYSSSDWSSELFSYGLDADGLIDVANKVKATYTTGTNRNIWYRSASSNNVSALKTASNTDIANTFGVTASVSSTTLVPWLQGNAAESVANGTRKANPFGDVLNSDISTTNQGQMVVVGANDGMVHVFKKNLSGVGYAEIFTYIPSLAKRQDGGTIAKAIPNITKSNYGKSTNEHEYLVDGGSFYRGVASTDQHIVVGSTGRGGAGVYALDMTHIRTSPTNGNASSVLFDLTNGSNGGYNNLGYTVGTPVIAKLADAGSSKLVALVPNGYFSKKISTGSQGLPALYAVNLESPNQGKVYQELVTYQATSADKNGLSSPVVVDTDSDGYADYAYAGDLKGDLYRFDLRSTKTNSSNIVKIFSGSPSKPITSAPTVFKQGNKLTIIFGTGSLLEASDNVNMAQQSVYGIIDDLEVSKNLTAATQQPVSEAQLLEQDITDVNLIRTTTRHSLNAAHKGWRFNLGSGDGERVIYQPIVWGNTLFLTSQIIVPPEKELLCAAGSGAGYVMVVDAETGGVPKAINAHVTSFDLNLGVIGSKVQDGVPSQIGGLSPTVLNTSGTNVEGQILPGIVPTTNPKDPTYTGGNYGANKRQQTNLSFSIGGGQFGQLKTEGAVPTKGLSNVRLLSWREIF